MLDTMCMLGVVPSSLGQHNCILSHQRVASTNGACTIGACCCNSHSSYVLELDAVASSMDWYSSTPSLNCAGHPSQLAQTTANPKFEAAKNVPSHQGSSVSDLQSAHGLVPNTSSSIAKNTSGGRVAFVIKKQMGKGTAKSAAARFGQEREVAYLKVGQSSQGQVRRTNLVQGQLCCRSVVSSASHSDPFYVAIG